MTTNPNITISNMELTPMMVKFKQNATDVAATDIGGTLDNVVITAKYGKAEIKADQLGLSVLDRRVNEITVSVTTSITEVQDKETLKILFPHATLVSSGGNFALDFKTNVGDGDLSNAGELTLHPLSKDVSDVSTDWTFYKACASAESEFSYGPSEQVKAKIVWNILPDTSVTPYRWFRYGDPALS